MSADLISTAFACHAQFAELDHNFDVAGGRPKRRAADA